MGTRITFRRPDGKDAQGYLAKAGRAGAPGVVVIQEWWGLQDQIKGICDRLALAGYDALAPDLFNGTVVPYHDRDAAGKQMNSLNFVAATEQDVRGAAQYLKRSSPKVGITGFCMGGAITIIAAAKVPEFAAGVCYYGIPPDTVAAPADIKIPVQGHFASQDTWCTPEAANTFEKAAKAAGKTVEFHHYDAGHGFVNEQRPDVHERAAAEQAWSRMLDFWKKHLG